MGSKGGGGSSGGSHFVQDSSGQLVVGDDGDFIRVQSIGPIAPRAPAPAPAPAPPQIPTFEFPSFNPGVYSNPYESAPRVDPAIEQARVDRENDLTTLDELWAARIEAATRAGKDVAKQIDLDKANAELRGIDFSIDDAQKDALISDAFAELFSEQDQTRLDTLAGKYGNPEQDAETRRAIEAGVKPYEWQYSVIRGSAPKPADKPTSKPPKTAIGTAVSGTRKRKTSLLDDNTTKSVLG